MPEDIWLWLDRGSIILGYVTVVTVVSGAIYVLRFALDYRKRQRRLRGQTVGKTARPMALAISFGGGSIKTAVQDFLDHRYPDTPIPVREFVEPAEVTTTNVYLNLQRLRKLKERLQSEGVTELHMFYKGPIALGMGLGAIFDNWVSVKVYHNNRSGAYEEWLTLETAKAQPVIETVAEKMAEVLEERSPNPT